MDESSSECVPYFYTTPIPSWRSFQQQSNYQSYWEKLKRKKVFVCSKLIRLIEIYSASKTEHKSFRSKQNLKAQKRPLLPTPTSIYWRTRSEVINDLIQFSVIHTFQQPCFFKRKSFQKMIRAERKFLRGKAFNNRMSLKHEINFRWSNNQGLIENLVSLCSRLNQKLERLFY